MVKSNDSWCRSVQSAGALGRAVAVDDDLKRYVALDTFKQPQPNRRCDVEHLVARAKEIEVFPFDYVPLSQRLKECSDLDKLLYVSDVYVGTGERRELIDQQVSLSDLAEFARQLKVLQLYVVGCKETALF